MSRARAVVRDWVVPCGLGLAAAAAVVAGVEQGGWVATATVAAAWVALAAFVAWAVRVVLDASRELASWDDAPDGGSASPDLSAGPGRSPAGDAYPAEP